MVESSPATRGARVRFPANAFLYFCLHVGCKFVLSSFILCRKLNGWVVFCVQSAVSSLSLSGWPYSYSSSLSSPFVLCNASSLGVWTGNRYVYIAIIVRCGGLDWAHMQWKMWVWW